MIIAGPFIATCPDHGERPFRRCNPCAWWYCPEPDCWVVIPDEHITPDGASVMRWQPSEDRPTCHQWAAS